MHAVALCDSPTATQIGDLIFVTWRLCVIEPSDYEHRSAEHEHERGFSATKFPEDPPGGRVKGF